MALVVSWRVQKPKCNHTTLPCIFLPHSIFQLVKDFHILSHIHVVEYLLGSYYVPAPVLTTGMLP